jgi:hypothetical protein
MLSIGLALVALAMVAGDARASSARGGASATAASGKAGFVNKVTPPATPAPITFPPSLLGSPAPLLGNFEGDTEFWDAFWTAAAGIAPKQEFAPVDGWLIGVTVDGFAVSGDMPGPGGSQPFRVGIENVLATGQLQVVSTSDPPFRLPGVSGTYYFQVGPPSTGFAMRLQKGEVVSFDTRGGTWAVFSASPGSVTDDQTGKGLEQNAGAQWSGTQHPNVQLEMQVTEQPSVPTTAIDRLIGSLEAAIRPEQLAEGASRKDARRELTRASLQLLSVLSAAEGAAQQADFESPAEISADTLKSIKHYVSVAGGEDLQAEGKGLNKAERIRHIKAAIEAKRAAISDARKARSLAKQLP